MPPGSQFALDERIRHIGRLPIGRTTWLDHVPAQDDAGVSGAGLGGGLGIHIGFNNAEARVWGRRLRRDRQREQ